MTIDLLPTLAGWRARRSRPNARSMDATLWPVMSGERGAKAPHEVLYFYWGAELHAVRSGKWKLHLPHPYQSLESLAATAFQASTSGKRSSCRSSTSRRPGESTNVSAANPEMS